MLDLAVLGRLSLRRDDRELLSGRRKLLAILAYLAHQRRPVTRAALAAMFWPEADESRARQSLRTALTDLRGELGEMLVVDGEQLSLGTGTVSLDSDRFETLIKAGDLRGADHLWGGDFLASLEDVGDVNWRAWLEAERGALRIRRRWLLERLVSLAEQEGRWQEAVGHAERWVAEFPGDEQAVSRRMGALKAAGRPGEQVSRPGTRGLLTPDLIGREAVFQKLSAAWSEVQQGQGRIVLVSADEGLGKTRLIEEFGRSLHARGTGLIVQGRAFASEQQRSASALVPILDQLAVAAGLSAVPPASLAVLGALSPAIRERFPATSSAVEPTDRAVLRALTDVAYETPVALLIDDATVADAATCDILRQLIRRPPPGLLLVLTGSTASWAAWEGRDEHARLDHLRSLVLDALSLDETRRLLASVAPIRDPSADPLIERLHRESGGRPGLLLLLLNELIERGDLATIPNGEWRLTTNLADLVLPIPAELADRVAARLRQLDPAGRAMIEAAAVIGPRIDPLRLEEVTESATPDFSATLTDLMARRILRTSLGGSGVLEFANEAERRIVVERMAPSARRALEDRATGRSRYRRLWLAVAAVVLLATSIGAVLLARSANRSAEPLLVVLAGIVNQTSDSTLGTTLDLAARVGLQQSTQVRLISQQQIFESMSRMRLDPRTTPVDPAVAREVALRENLGAFIVLSIAELDSAYLITGRVVQPEPERDRVVSSVTAPGRGGILAGLDEVLKQIRTGLGESKKIVRRADQSLPRVTTSSLDALRLFTRGRVQWTAGQYRDAGRSWREAVRLDTAFAMALNALGQFYYLEGDSGIDHRAGDLYLDRAIVHSDRLTERERLVILAATARSRGDPIEALERLRVLVARYPDRDTWYDLGTALMRMERGGEAIGPLTRSVELDPNFANAWVNLASAHVINGEIDSALVAYARAAEIDSERMHRGGNVSQEWGAALLRSGREAQAESLFIMATQIAGPLTRPLGMRSMAFLEMYRGHYQSAIRWLETAVDSMTRTESSRLSIARNQWLAASVYLDLGDTARARATLNRAESTLGALATDPIFLYHLGFLWLQAGDLTGALRLQRRVDSLAKPRLADQEVQLLFAASVALAQHDPGAAIRLAHQSTRREWTAFRETILSRAFEETGALDSAVLSARRVDSTWAFGYEAQRLVRHAGYRVASLALRQGDTALARTAATRQVERWRAADPAIPDLVRSKKLLASIVQQ